MSRLSKKVIGITLGDPGGIGPEVVAKSLERPFIQKLARFKIIGHWDIYKRYSKRENQNCDFVDINHISSKKFKLGQKSTIAAKASMDYLKEAIHMLKRGEINALVTAPVCKEAIHSFNKKFQGHTEFLSESFHVKKYGMMFVSQHLRTIVVTRHVPINQLSRSINKDNIFDTIELTDKALKQHFRIRQPKIAVCGLNPHAGEGGTIGKEEIYKIIPAMKKASKKGIHTFGPFSADTLFYPKTGESYDAIIAMYHDQGLIPIKTLYFNHLVNLTIGLPFVRTSPAHGTAFDIAGKHKADPSSMEESIKVAAQLS